MAIDEPTPKHPRPGTSALAAPHTIEIELADPAALADFLDSLAFMLRVRRRVRVTIE